MKRAPGLGHIVLAIVLIVTFAYADTAMPIWEAALIPPRRTRRRYNPRRNLERWVRRWAKRERQRPQQKRSRRQGVERKEPVLASVRASSTFPVPLYSARRKVEGRKSAVPPPPGRASRDPLADLRARRGWIDCIHRPELWRVLVRIRWPHGPCCPHCGEKKPRYLKSIDPTYRDGLGRWRCLVCAEAGDPGEGGTFTPLTGTIMDGMRVDVRAFWLIVEGFVEGRASVETAGEAGVNRHTSDRFFRLLRAAIYQTRSTKPITLGSEDVVEGDEVYITAGLKGCAGGRMLDRPPRRRGLKRRGRGTWDSDRLPVFGLLCRGGEVRLFVLRNVQTDTIRPIVEQMVQRGACVYTDGYSIYHFLSREGYRHEAAKHGVGEYALDLDGDGKCEVHCNTIECTWSWLRQMLRTYRGVSKVYLPIYVAQFEFLFNRRHQNRWNCTLDLLHAVFQVDATDAADLLERVQTARFAEVRPVTG